MSHDADTTEANSVIQQARQGCVDRGEGRGKCHVFLDHSDVCECGERRLTRATNQTDV